MKDRTHQSQDDIQAAYDLAAPQYAEKFIEELDHKPLDSQWLKMFVDSLELGAKVLDLGCGPGHTTAHLASLKSNPIGVDLSPEMIRQASQLFPELEFRIGDFFLLEEPDNSVAGILAFYCIVHLQRNQLKLAFLEMFRVLRSGGTLLLSFHVGDEPIFVESFLDSGAALEFYPHRVTEIQSCLEAVGFNNLSIHERAPYEIEYPSTRCYIFATK